MHILIQTPSRAGGAEHGRGGRVEPAVGAGRWQAPGRCWARAATGWLRLLRLLLLRQLLLRRRRRHRLPRTGRTRGLTAERSALTKRTLPRGTRRGVRRRGAPTPPRGGAGSPARPFGKEGLLTPSEARGPCEVRGDEPAAERGSQNRASSPARRNGSVRGRGAPRQRQRRGPGRTCVSARKAASARAREGRCERGVVRAPARDPFGGVCRVKRASTLKRRLCARRW